MKRKRTGEHAGRKAKSLIRIQPAVDDLLKKTAAYLNRQADRVTRKNMQYILLVVCLTWALAVGFILYRSIRRPGKILSITALSLPKHTYADTSYRSFSRIIRQRISLDRKYLDSLKKNNHKAYDSLKNKRPGLIDSLELIETYYSPLK